MRAARTPVHSAEVTAGMALIDRIRSSGAPYLSVLVVTPMAGQFVHFLQPSTPVLKGQPAAVLVEFALVAIAVLLWWPYRPRTRWPAAFHVFMAALMTTWAVAMGLAVAHEDNFDLTSLLVPVFLLLIWVKKPSLADAWRAADAFAWAVVLSAVLAQTLSWLGWHELHREGWNRLPLLGELIGPIGRWEGPFGNVNLAGPIGAFLFAYGLYRRGATRVVFIVGGLAIVFFSDSRMSMLAIAATLVLALLFVDQLGSWRPPLILKVLAPLALAGIVAGYLVLVDPTVNGRTDIWSEFVSLWTSSKWTGVGATGIADAIGAGDLPGWANHGHSLVLDPLGRVGLAGFVPLLTALTAGVVLAITAARAGTAAGLVVLTGFLASGITEDLADWRYVSYQVVPLVMAVILAASSVRSHARLQVTDMGR